MNSNSAVAETLEPRPYVIAVVDDEEMVTFAIKKALKSNPRYEIHTFNSPTEAVAAFEGLPLDLIISDYLMPQMSGTELLAKVKEMRPEATRIMLTAYADKESVIKAINDVGLFFYLEKPWENEDLRLVVQRGLEKGDLVAELKDRVIELEQTNEELRQAREELIRGERLSAIGQMASTIIHDFKGPMTAILGFSELMAMPDFDAEEKQDLYKSIRSEIERMVDMTSEVLDFTRGEISLSRESIKLEHFLGEAIKPMDRVLKRKEVEISLTHGADDPVAIDRRRFRRVVENLVGNAVDAMEEGGRIEISTREGEGHVELEIRDSGKGIPDEIRETLFQPFVTHGKKHGTGLGMAITKRIVESHGGTIAFESQAGEGTTFVIRIPREAPSAS